MEERIGIYGIGIKHNLLQWIPIAEKAPIDLSVMVGYSQAKYILNIPQITSSISGQITYPETQDEHLYRATTINLLLSEIIFTINDKKELKSKYEEIEKSINEIGFEETARIYSLSKSKKSGGNLGWIYKNQLSKNVRESLNEIQIGGFTEPIVTSGGFLILKLNDLKTEDVKINKDAQLKKMIEFERERQFTRFSTLYYKRVFNNTEINEK
mgnify:CR=1 FL=1